MVGIIKFLPENHPKSDAKMIYKFHEDKYTYNGLIKLGLVKKMKEGREFRLFITEKGRSFLEDKNL